MEHKYKIADIPFRAIHNYDYLTKQLEQYETVEEEKYVIEITKEDIDYEKTVEDGYRFSDAMLELSALHRKYCNLVAKENIVLIHAFAIEAKGKAYLFCAPSGTGKTTHGLLWKELKKDEVEIIDGDKPLIKVLNNEIMVYGTPWNGKEHYGVNKCVPLGGICILERSKENTIETIPNEDIVKNILGRFYRPEKFDDLSIVMNNIVKISKNVKAYKLGCNISLDAAKLSFTTMVGE